MAAALALLVAVFPSASDRYLAILNGTPIGSVAVSLTPSESGQTLVYASETFVRRGPTVTRNEARATLQIGDDRTLRRVRSERYEAGVPTRSVIGTREGQRVRISAAGSDGQIERFDAPASSLPSSLALSMFTARRRCILVLEETTGRSGEACGERSGEEIRGTLLGERFVAQVHGERLERLELVDQRMVFQRTEETAGAFDPPDLMETAVKVDGLEGREEDDKALTLLVQRPASFDWPQSANQRSRKRPEGWQVIWSRARPPAASPAWRAAQRIAAAVDRAIPDKRPAAFERSPERVLAQGRGACVAHTEAFMALARREGLSVRPALGLVAAEGSFWPHAWPQVEVAGVWYDVDPVEGAAPARSARILFAAGEAAGEHGAARLADLVRTLKITVVR